MADEERQRRLCPSRPQLHSNNTSAISRVQTNHNTAPGPALGPLLGVSFPHQRGLFRVHKLLLFCLLPLGPFSSSCTKDVTSASQLVYQEGNR